MNSAPPPPALARRLLALALPDDARDHIVNELDEVYARTCEQDGHARARRWYWRETLAFTGGFTLERVRERATGRTPFTFSHNDKRGPMQAFFEGWVGDFKHAARSLVRVPGFTFIVVLTLALAIGANAAIFSVVNAVLLNPMPYPNADRLVFLAGSAPGTDQPAEFGVPDELYFEYRESAPAIEDIAIYGIGAGTTRVNEQVDQLFFCRATPSLFSTLGAQPAAGRLPNDKDDDKVVVISHSLWKTWFGSDPNVIGRTHLFGQSDRTVIGIMPPEFRFPDERVQMWIPLPLSAAKVSPGGFGPSAVARLKPGADRAALMAQLEPLARRVQERLGGPAPYVNIMQRHRPIVKPLRDHLAGGIATPLWILLGTVAIVFLIACANVANLFTARAEGRRRDLAVRRALGARRGDLVRSQVSEALLLAFVGGALGALIAWVGVPLLVSAAPEAGAGGFGSAPIPGLAEASLDRNSLLFTLGISLLAACAFGLLPALGFSGAQMGMLKDAGRGIVSRRSVVRDTLVVVQTASALILLVGSALLMRSFWQLSNVDAGYDTKNIFTFQIVANRPDLLKDRSAMSRFQYTFMDRLKALPGVESVGYITTLPLDEGADTQNLTTPKILASGAEAPSVRYAGAGGAYFQTMGISLLSGRFFDRVEEEQGIDNVIISKTAAQLLFPNEDPLNKQLKPAAGNSDWFTVVGVVEDVIVDDLRRDKPEPMVYLPTVSASPAYVMRSTRADQLVPEVRSIIREVMPTSPMYRIFTMERLAANAMASLSFTMLMVGIAAVLALVLGAVGLYGVLSYRVTRSAREIGVRMALGQEAGSVRWMFVRQGGQVALIGVVVGVLGAVALTKYIQTLLFGVQRLDVAAFAGMSAVMLAVALLASYVPARRASRVDPVVALRND